MIGGGKKLMVRHLVFFYVPYPFLESPYKLAFVQDFEIPSNFLTSLPSSRVRS